MKELIMNADKFTKIDLVKCPHILIGGSTGSGKSYLMKSMLCDILRHEDVKVIVIDPKSVDYKFVVFGRGFSKLSEEQGIEIRKLWAMRGLGLYDRDSIDNLNVSRLLKWLCEVMDQRYSFMKNYGFVEWGEFIDWLKVEWPDWLEGMRYGKVSDDDALRGRGKISGPGSGKLFISERLVLVIDELADLMFWDRQKVRDIKMDREDRVVDSMDALRYALRDRYGTDDIELINAGKVEEDRVNLSNLVSMGLITKEEYDSMISRMLMYGGTGEDYVIRGGRASGKSIRSLNALIDRIGDGDRIGRIEDRNMLGEVERGLVRLATMGRAAGIHLILGTQRPDAQILSGQLRANIPSRICLRVNTSADRRIILGDSCKDLGERVLLYNSEYIRLERALE